jgi:hypothetical protein
MHQFVEVIGVKLEAAGLERKGCVSKDIDRNQVEQDDMDDPIAVFIVSCVKGRVAASG